MIVSRRILIRMTNISDKICRENQYTHQGSVTLFLFRKFYRLLENMEKYCRAGQTTDDNKIERVRFACWIPNVTHTRTHTHTY